MNCFLSLYKIKKLRMPKRKLQKMFNFFGQSTKDPFHFGIPDHGNIKSAKIMEISILGPGSLIDETDPDPYEIENSF